MPSNKKTNKKVGKSSLEEKINNTSKKTEVKLQDHIEDLKKIIRII